MSNDTATLQIGLGKHADVAAYEHADVFFYSSGLGDRMSCLKRDVSIQMGVESSLGVEVCAGLLGGWRYSNVE